MSSVKLFSKKDFSQVIQRREEKNHIQLPDKFIE